MGSVCGVLKKGILEITQKDFHISMALKSLKRKVGCKKKRESCADKSILLKPMGSFVGGDLKKRMVEMESTQEEEKGNDGNALKTTEFHDDEKKVLESPKEEEKGNAETQMKNTELHDEAKKVLLDWRKIKRERQREAARLELEQIKNTAGFGDNMEAMIEFEKICGYSMSYPTYTWESCYVCF